MALEKYGLFTKLSGTLMKGSKTLYAGLKDGILYLYETLKDAELDKPAGNLPMLVFQIKKSFVF